MPEQPTYLPASYPLGLWVFGGESTRGVPSMYSSRLDWGATPMEAARSSWGPDMRKSRYDEDDDEDLEEDEFDEDEFDEDDDLFDDDEDLEDDEFLEDDEDEDLF